VCVCVYTHHADTHARSHTRILSHMLSIIHFLTHFAFPLACSRFLSLSLSFSLVRALSHICAVSVALSHALSHTHARTYARTHTSCTHAAHPHARTHTCTHPRTHTHMHARMHARTYTWCIHARTQQRMHALTDSRMYTQSLICENLVQDKRGGKARFFSIDFSQGLGLHHRHDASLTTRTHTPSFPPTRCLTHEFTRVCLQIQRKRSDSHIRAMHARAKEEVVIQICQIVMVVCFRDCVLVLLPTQHIYTSMCDIYVLSR